MATLIVVTSPDDVEGFVALALRCARPSAFPTLAVYKGHTHVAAGEFDAIEGVSWLDELDLEHHFAESLERLAISRVVLQVHEGAFAADQCCLLQHNVRKCRQAEIVLLDRGTSPHTAIPDRALVPANCVDPGLAIQLSHQIVDHNGWTVVVAAQGCRASDRDQASLRIMEVLKDDVLESDQRVSSTLVPTPGQSDAVRAMLTEHDILMLGEATFEDVQQYRSGNPGTGDLPVPVGTAIAAIRAPALSRRRGFLNRWSRSRASRLAQTLRPSGWTKATGWFRRMRRAELLLALAGSAILVLAGILLKLNLWTVASLMSLLGGVLVPVRAAGNAVSSVGPRMPIRER